MSLFGFSTGNSYIDQGLSYTPVSKAYNIVNPSKKPQPATSNPLTSVLGGSSVTGGLDDLLTGGVGGFGSQLTSRLGGLGSQLTGGLGGITSGICGIS